jgi:hypothetical protein
MIAGCRWPLGAIAIAAAASVAPAQGAVARWNDSATLALVNRAIARRAAQLADTGLTDYRAVAHGYVTFFAQVGEGFPDPPQVVRADEVAVEVSWRAPNQSKQRIVGRRDTLLLPTDINYHRDHLAVVQNNFPAIIRLGDGDEVRDVPHPLSVAGREAYEFAVADSLAIRVAGRSWDVIAVDVRPLNERQPRVVGTIYLDRATGSVVRMSLTFTRAALLDPALEDISVSLDNGLVEGRFWLPRRQEIEIRRRGQWLDFPARGIIRGEWDLCCVEPNRGLPRELFVGPEITFAPPQELSRYPFAGSIGDSLRARVMGAGAGRPAAELQRRAVGLVGLGAIARANRVVATAASVSDFVRVNRVEGLALGAGGAGRFPRGLEARSAVRYGLDDARLKYRVAVSAQAFAGIRVAMNAFDEYREAREAPEMSRLGNSLAAAEFGSDFTDEFRATGMALSLSAGARWRWRSVVEQVRQRALAVHARPFRGTFRPAFPADAFDGTRAQFGLASPHLPLTREVTLQFALAAALHWPDAAAPGASRSSDRLERLSASVDLRRTWGGGDLVVSARGVTAGSDAPTQAGAVFGGPTSAPGFPAGALTGRYGATARAEWRADVTGFRLRLGRFGVTRVPVIFAPYANAAWIEDPRERTVRVPYRSLGLGVITAHGLVRFDVARGVDRLGGWTFYTDFGRAFWPIL